MNNKKIKKNIILVLLSQMFSIVVGLVLGFVVPKFIDELQYAYWQSFLLYYGYSSLLTFGLIDGFVLRYSNYDYEDLPRERVKAFFKALLLVAFFTSLVIIVVSQFALTGHYKSVLLLVGVGAFIHTLWTYNYTILNTTNRADKYARYVFVYRLSYLLIIVVLLLLKISNFIYYCIAEIISEFLAFILSIRHNRGLYFGRALPFKEAKKELSLLFAGGIILLLANFTGNFIVNGAKTIIEIKWDKLTFGAVSFGFSATNIFLTLVTTVSVVLFPSLKRIDEKNLPATYIKIRDSLTPLIFICFIAYFPLRFVLNIWLPNYSASLVYLGSLLPITYSISLANLLTNNYFKAYRKEKIMLLINLSCVAFGFLSYYFAWFFFKNVELIIFCVIIISFTRLYLSEFVIYKIMNKKMSLSIFFEVAISVSFVLCNRYLGLYKCLVVYFFILVIYLIINQGKINYIINHFTQRKCQ